MFRFIIETDEGLVTLKAEPDEANNLIVILDSDDEEDSHEQRIVSTNPKAVVGDEVGVATDSITTNGRGSSASMIQNQNSNRNDGNVSINMDDGHVGVKMGVDDIDDIPLIVIQALLNAPPNAEPMTNKVSHKRSSSKNVERSIANMQSRSNVTNSRSLSNITPNESLANNKRTVQAWSVIATPAQSISKVPRKSRDDNDVVQKMFRSKSGS